MRLEDDQKCWFSSLQETSVFILPSFCKFHFYSYLLLSKREKKEKEWKNKRRIKKEAYKSNKELG